MFPWTCDLLEFPYLLLSPIEILLKLKNCELIYYADSLVLPTGPRDRFLILSYSRDILDPIRDRFVYYFLW